MIKMNQFDLDNRFFVDEWNKTRFIDGSAKGYDLVEIKLGDILRVLNGKVISISETAPYLYLTDKKNGKDIYLDYCKNYGEGRTYRGIDQYENLIKEVEKNGYDVKKGAIVVDELNIISEGQHRCCILLNMYGRDYTIPVVKIYYKSFRLKTRIKVFCKRIEMRFRNR